MVGGTVSAVTGGKFGNGAITAAFSRAFNDEAHLGRRAGEAGKEAHERALTRRTAYVGGAHDGKGGPVLAAFEKYGGQNDAYFEWTDGEALANWIDSNQGDYLKVIAHSYGGDTAAGVVANGHYVNELITVDPVGRFMPNLANVAKNTGVWTNYDSVGGGETWNNLVATAGGAWNNRPMGFADYHHTSNLGHVGICVQFCRP